MCTLKYPFKPDDGSFTNLGVLVKEAQYDELPDQYSDNLKTLLRYLLQVNPAKRPSINKIFTHPSIREKLPQVLSYETFKDEFTHTILHGRDILKEV